MMLTTHFSLEEFVATNHRNINNTLPQGLMSNALKTCNMLERIRAYLSMLKGSDVSITLSSGYRCKALNDAVGSSDTSDHLQALAADWNARSFGTPYEVCMALAPQVSNLDIGQLIHEFGTWIHTGERQPSKPINRIITINGAGTRAGILKV
jgi:zinc D-Ala-D-Ala carboxypeptidase